MCFNKPWSKISRMTHTNVRNQHMFYAAICSKALFTGINFAFITQSSVSLKQKPKRPRIWDPLNSKTNVILLKWHDSLIAKFCYNEIVGGKAKTTNVFFFLIFLSNHDCKYTFVQCVTILREVTLTAFF